MSDAISITNTIARQAFQLFFEISPILLNGGIATAIDGYSIPIVALTQSAGFSSLLGGSGTLSTVLSIASDIASLLSGGFPDSLDEFFAHWQPMPGGTLLDLQFAQYPLANQAVAANAMIVQPLRVTMLMKAPAGTAGGYVGKYTTISALKNTLTQHALLGGYYTVVTPALAYTNMLLERIRDVSSGDDRQVQNAWAFDFFQPLITQQQAQGALNALMQNLNNNTPIDGQPGNSGPQNSISPSGLPNTLLGNLNSLSGNITSFFGTPAVPGGS